MSLMAKNTGGDFELAPIGAHIGRCVSVIDLGTQHGEYEGRPNVNKKVWILWELPSEKMKDGRPFGVSAFYTLSLGEKANLRRDLESWRGRAFTEEEMAGFNLMNILDKSCMISVIHTDKGKSKVNGVMAIPKGMICPDRINDLLSFDIDEWDQAAFDNIPEGIRAIIMKSDEYLDKIAQGSPNVREGCVPDDSQILF